MCPYMYVHANFNIYLDINARTPTAGPSAIFSNPVTSGNESVNSAEHHPHAILVQSM